MWGICGRAGAGALFPNSDPEPVCPSGPGLPFLPVLCPRETLRIYTPTANPNHEPARWEDLAGHQTVGVREGEGSCLPASVLSWAGLCPSELRFLLYLQL